MADNYPDPHTCMRKLNEHCQKYLLKLEYKDIAVTGPSHDRVFTVAVVIGNVQYEPATGKSKKEAKAQAAVLAWDTIQKGEPNSREQHEEPMLSPLSPSVSESTSSDSINYVSLLNEYALKNKVHVQYNFISKTGLEHKPIFSYECRIGDTVFDVGRGNKAQIAKFEAAKLAYEKLTSSSTFRAEESAKCASDSSDTTFSGSQELSSEASGSSTDLGSELKKTSDTFTQHTNAVQQNETSSTQNSVSSPSQSVKSKRKEIPLAASFSKLCIRTSKFTKNDRFLKEFDDINTIGSGGFGNVFKAKNIIDDRLCAIKRIRLSGKRDNGETEKREAKALAKLDHPHIIRYYGCWSGKDIFQFPDTSVISSEQYDCLFIHMELCEKGNLSNWLDKKMGNSCKDVSIMLFQQIVQGVDYIHSMDLIHRDLKPLNVFFHSENHIKIGDFGLVTEVDVGERTVNKGTLYYMAPEQEGRNYGKKVDIFPLGLILYEMLSPFCTHAEKYQEWPNIKEGKFPITFTEKFSEETSLIKKLLSKEPTQRPSAADILTILKGQSHRVHTY